MSKTKIYRRQLQTIPKSLNKGPVHPTDQAVYNVYKRLSYISIIGDILCFSINIIIELYAYNYSVLKEIHR